MDIEDQMGSTLEPNALVTTFQVQEIKESARLPRADSDDLDAGLELEMKRTYSPRSREKCRVKEIKKDMVEMKMNMKGMKKFLNTEVEKTGFRIEGCERKN